MKEIEIMASSPKIAQAMQAAMEKAGLKATIAKPVEPSKTINHHEITINIYKESTASVHVLLSSSAHGKWIAALHGKEPTGEWFAITKKGEIVARGTKQAVNRALNNAGYSPSKTEANAWL